MTEDGTQIAIRLAGQEEADGTADASGTSDASGSAAGGTEAP